MAHIVVLGGTGKVGRRLVDLLDKAGHEVRPVGRATSVRFDWHDESTWDEALARADAMFVVGPGSATDWSPALTRLLGRAERAGVGHAVLLSARGVEFLPDGAVARAERALIDGPLAWTILRPAHFAQNFTEAMFVPAGGRIVAPVGGGVEPFVDTQDIAEVAAAVLTGNGHRGELLELSGPVAITFAEAATILGGVSGVAVRFESEGDDEHVARLRAAGTPEGYIRWRMAMLGGIRSGADAYLSDGVRRVLGRPATDFSTWARREAANITER